MGITWNSVVKFSYVAHSGTSDNSSENVFFFFAFAYVNLFARNLGYTLFRYETLARKLVKEWIQYD